ncbi:MAG: metallophosphoesterase family protein [Elusimicrobia bacterium]|nr:metallophosphoesterase family protein [Elusimicrobiota bacterium]
MPPEKLIVISDVHSNLPALEAVLADISRRGLSAAPVCFLGDAVDLGPFPAETVGLLRSLNLVLRVKGNHDRYAGDGAPRAELERYLRCAEGADHVRWTGAALSREDRVWLASAPLTACLTLGGAVFRCFHASPHSDEVPFSPDSLEGGVLCGHTHAPFIRVYPGGALLVNPGSVGGPLDGNPAASYALLTLNGRAEAEIVRVPYDLELFSAGLRRGSVPWGPAIDAVVRRASFRP